MKHGCIERDLRWHIEILPRLHPHDGIELATGCWLNSVWPEVAAAHLRAVDLPRMIARQAFYEGRVQGVGFRFTCKQLARGYEVVGWVRNLPDGRVELQCSGESAEVDAFLAAIAASELKSHIKTAIVVPIPPLEVRGFEITR